MAKKKSVAKKPTRARAKKSTVGLSEAEHGQGWERDEVSVNVPYDGEVNGDPGDEDDYDDEDDNGGEE
jgi:hypothetical protein